MNSAHEVLIVVAAVVNAMGAYARVELSAPLMQITTRANGRCQNVATFATRRQKIKSVAGSRLGSARVT